MPQSKFNLIILASLVFVLLAGFWLRASSLEQYPPGVSNDEAKNLIDSVYISQTGRTPFYEDEGRPEPINRLISAMGAILYGNSIWAFRLTSAFWGLITLSTMYWTATQCFHDTSPQHRKLIGLFATIALAIALGHLTVTRSLYRAVPLPFFILMTIGFTVRGLRTYKWSDFFWVGVFVACGIYTYTSGFVVPIVFLLLGAFLLITRFKDIKQWLPRLMLTGIILAILTSPIIYLLLTQPSAVLARASDVSQATDSSLTSKLEIMAGQFFTEGDENPQYNVANAPLIAQMLIPFFFIGIGALLLRFRRPSSLIIGGLLLLNIIPVILTDEITHGLRIYSEFAIIPLVIGASLAPIFWLTEKFAKPSVITYIGLIAILIIGLFQINLSHQTYTGFWNNADTEWRRWVVYDRELTHNEWFFRSDRKALTDWIKAQDTPLLLPVEELYRDAQRGMLMSHYPYVDSANDITSLPDNTQVVITWSLEKGDFLTETKHFALLQDETITLLPPLTEASHQQLLKDISSATDITYDSDNIPVVAKAYTPSNTSELSYDSPIETSSPLAIFNDELEIISWYGEETITNGGETIYTIDWSVNRPVSHEYGAFVQILTQDWERITGKDKLITRWLYPTIAWHPNQVIPDTFKLDILDDLAVGAYRLVAGAWYVNGGRMPAQSFFGDMTNNTATIGWLKVPQDTTPTIPPEAFTVDVTLNNQFHLTHANVSATNDGKFRANLYWQSRVHRPDIDATVFVHALDMDNNIISQSDIRPMNGQYPTFIWDENEIVVTEHILELENIEGIRLVASMYTQPDFTRLTATQNNELLPDNLIELGQLSELIEE